MAIRRSVGPLLALLISITMLSSPGHSSPAKGPEQAQAAEAAAKVKTCNGRRATLVGTRGRNTIIGTNRRDIIWAGAGIDTVLGRGGRDLICGGRGSDLIDGGRRVDHLYGGGQRDQCFGPRIEHRNNLHHSCEVHRIPRPKQGSGTPRVLDSEQAALPSGHAALRRSHSFDFDIPLCADVPGDADIVNWGSIYYTGLYDPGYIGFRVNAYRWEAGGWTGPFYGNWYVVDAPADGQVYTYRIGSQRLGTTIVAYYEVIWGDGDYWDEDTRTYYQPPYYIMQGYGTRTATPFCQGFHGVIGP